MQYKKWTNKYVPKFAATSGLIGMHLKHCTALFEETVPWTSRNPSIGSFGYFTLRKQISYVEWLEMSLFQTWHFF